MAVSKEELFARYKQLKSEGVSITLMELKKQMEAEESSSPSQSETEFTPNQSGFKALSSSSTSTNEQPTTQIASNETINSSQEISNNTCEKSSFTTGTNASFVVSGSFVAGE